MGLRRQIGVFLLACAAVFAVLTTVSLFVPHAPLPPVRDLQEAWRSDLSDVRSMDQAIAILPRYFARQQGTRDERIARGIDQFVRDRFIHGVSKTRFQQDWLDWLSGFVWVNLREPVSPDDILDHRHAICSQQSIVFQALLKHYGIEYASVVMNWPSVDPLSSGHFAVAAKIDGQWRYFDADQEARVVGVPVADVLDGRDLARLYPDKPGLIANMRYAAAHGKIVMAHVNQFPAPRGALFQKMTRSFSAFGWLAFGVLGLFCLGIPLPRRRRAARPLACEPGTEPSFATAVSTGFLEPASTTPA